MDLLDRQVRWPTARMSSTSITCCDRERVERRETTRDHFHPRPSQLEPQIIRIPMSDGEDDDDQPLQGERRRQRSRSREREHTHTPVPQEPQIQSLVPPEPDNVSDENFTALKPSSTSAGPPPSAEQGGRSRRVKRSRSQERVPQNSSSHAGQQPQPVVPPSEVQQT